MSIQKNKIKHDANDYSRFNCIESTSDTSSSEIEEDVEGEDEEIDEEESDEEGSEEEDEGIESGKNAQDLKNKNDRKQQNDNKKDEIYANKFKSKIEEATKAKDKGNHCFKNAEYDAALKYYLHGIKLMYTCKNLLQSMALKYKKSELMFLHQDSIMELLTYLYNNCSIMYIKLGQYRLAIESCDLVLQYDMKNIKALYRRSVGYMRLHQIEEAKADLCRILEIDPTNAIAKKELVVISKMLKDMKLKEKAAYVNMFGCTSNSKSTAANEARDNASANNNIVANDSPVTPPHKISKSQLKKQKARALKRQLKEQQKQEEETKSKNNEVPATENTNSLDAQTSISEAKDQMNANHTELKTQQHVKYDQFHRYIPSLDGGSDTSQNNRSVDYANNNCLWQFTADSNIDGIYYDINEKLFMPPLGLDTHAKDAPVVNIINFNFDRMVQKMDFDMLDTDNLMKSIEKIPFNSDVFGVYCDCLASELYKTSCLCRELDVTDVINMNGLLDDILMMDKHCDGHEQRAILDNDVVTDKNVKDTIPVYAPVYHEHMFRMSTLDIVDVVLSHVHGSITNVCGVTMIPKMRDQDFEKDGQMDTFFNYEILLQFQIQFIPTAPSMYPIETAIERACVEGSSSSEGKTDEVSIVPIVNIKMLGDPDNTNTVADSAKTNQKQQFNTTNSSKETDKYGDDGHQMKNETLYGVIHKLNGLLVYNSNLTNDDEDDELQQTTGNAQQQPHQHASKNASKGGREKETESDSTLGFEHLLKHFTLVQFTDGHELYMNAIIKHQIDVCLYKLKIEIALRLMHFDGCLNDRY